MKALIADIVMWHVSESSVVVISEWGDDKHNWPVGLQNGFKYVNSNHVLANSKQLVVIIIIHKKVQ